jgi:hypothetical protein
MPGFSKASIGMGFNFFGDDMPSDPKATVKSITTA